MNAALFKIGRSGLLPSCKREEIYAGDLILDHSAWVFGEHPDVGKRQVTKVHAGDIHPWDVADAGTTRYEGYDDGPPSGFYLRLGPSMNATSYYAAYAESRYAVTACFHDHQTVYSAAACIHSAGGYVVAVEDGVLRALSDTEEVEFQKAMRGRALPSVASDYDYLFRVNRGMVKPS
jgi:hypothetical protein